MGTLLAFTAVAVSILILRYTPPEITLLQSQSPESIDIISSEFGDDITDFNTQNHKDIVGHCRTQKGAANVCFNSRTIFPSNFFSY